MIIPAEKQHIPLIRAIAEKSWAATYRTILSGEQYTYMMDLFYSIPALEQIITEQVFLLHDTRGFAAYQLEYPAAGDCKIHKLYILPEAQGAGVGRNLVDAMEMIAHEAGCKRLVLNVNKYNPALGFYQKMGFREERSEVIDIGGGFVMDDYVLVKNLTPPSKRAG